MMRVHRPSDDTIRAAGFAPNESLRFPAGEFDAVADPRDADIILPGVDLFALHSREEFLRAPCVRDFESRCALSDCADNLTKYHTPAMLLRGNLSQDLLADSPNSIAWPWPVEDHGALGVQPATRNGFSHDVGFHGWLSRDTSVLAVESCRREFGASFDVATYSDFAGYLFTAEGKPLPEFTRRRACYVESMTRSRLQLCPESIPGVLRYRVLEALSAARVPIVVTSGVVLPWADEVPWSEFCVFVETRDAANVGPIARAWLKAHDDAEVIRMGILARKWWLARMDRDKAPALMRLAVERKARALGLVRNP